VVTVLTNDLHHLAWRGFAYDGLVVPQRGPANWAFIFYAYGLGVVNIIVLASLFARSPRDRWPVALMLTGQVAGRALYAAQAANIVEYPVRLDLAALAVPSVAYALALFGFRILDAIPLARRAVIAQMRDGVVVLDAQERVATVNPAAERILGASAKYAIGRPVRDLLPAYADLAGDTQVLEPDELEISLGTGSEPRTYVLAGSPLQDARGQIVGRLLLIRDVTERRRARAQALQQQWAEATLEERKLLAQELHDGLAQNLGFLNLQAQAAQVYLRQGQGEAARVSLDRLAQVAVEVQEDTRELIGNLLAVSFPSEGFCGALREAVAHFEEQNELPVSLAIADGVDAVCNCEAFSPVACMQLLRIAQEALANVRKHAGCPSQVSLELRTEPGQMHLTISDDGIGFDPALAGGDGNHFGLRVMRQRAARIGGQMSVRSALGEGTRVEVCVPLVAGQHPVENPNGLQDP
jgi:signal transduction histidine kinase